MHRAKPSYFVAGLIAITVAAYLPVWNNQFVDFDDEHYLTSNPQVMGGLSGSGFCWAWTTFHGAYWQPVTWLSFQFDAHFFSDHPTPEETILSPAAFHGQNLFWHLTNTLLLFFLWRRLSGAMGRSFVVAALFALHPMHVESVAWATERKDMLSVFFGLLTLFAYVRSVETPSWKWRLATAGAYFLSLASKPMLITLPFVLLLLDYWPLHRVASRRLPANQEGDPPSADAFMVIPPIAHIGRPIPLSLGRLFLEKWFLFLMAAGIAVLTVIARIYSGSPVALDQISLSARLANAMTAYGWYVTTTFWPTNLAVMYPHPYEHWSLGGALLGAAMVFGITILACWRAGRKRWLFTGWLWFLISLLPVIGLAQGGQQAWADRFTYWAHIGLFVAVVWGCHALLSNLRAPAWVPVAGVAVIFVALGVFTWVQIGYWRDTFTLWDHAVKVRENNDLAHVHLGKYYQDQGRPAEALFHFAEAVRIEPDSSDYHYFLGISYLVLGKLNEATAQLKETLQRNQNYVDAWHNLGVTRLRQGKNKNAATDFRRALELRPASADSLAGLGWALWREGKKQEAVKEFQAAAALDPREAQAWNGLGWDSLSHGNPDAAIGFFQRALNSKPNWPKAHSDLGLAYSRKKQWAAAVEHHRTAVSLAEQVEQKLVECGGAAPAPDSIPDVVLFRCRLAHDLHQLGYGYIASQEYNLVKKRDPHWQDHFRAKAWSLATSANENLLDPLWSLELMNQVFQALETPSASMLDTLAAAQANLGNFVDAVKNAQQALDLAAAAGNEWLAFSIGEHLHYYESGMAFTEGPD